MRLTATLRQFALKRLLAGTFRLTMDQRIQSILALSESCRAFLARSMWYLSAPLTEAHGSPSRLPDLPSGWTMNGSGTTSIRDTQFRTIGSEQLRVR